MPLLLGVITVGLSLTEEHPGFSQAETFVAVLFGVQDRVKSELVGGGCHSCA